MRAGVRLWAAVCVGVTRLGLRRLKVSLVTFARVLVASNRRLRFGSILGWKKNCFTKSCHFERLMPVLDQDTSKMSFRILS